jgi:hypothetical protein
MRMDFEGVISHGIPEKMTIDVSGTIAARIESYNQEHEAGIEVC